MHCNVAKVLCLIGVMLVGVGRCVDLDGTDSLGRLMLSLILFLQPAVFHHALRGPVGAIAPNS